MPTITVCHLDPAAAGGARGMEPPPRNGSEAASAEAEDPEGEEREKRMKARKSILVHVVVALVFVVLLLCGLLIHGLPRWAKRWFFNTELLVIFILIVVLCGAMNYVNQYSWYVPFKGKKPEPEVTGADLY